MQQVMKRATTMFLTLFLLLFLATPAVFAQGDPKAPTIQSSMKVNVTIANPEIFWNYSFLTKEGLLAKPASIKVIWSVGDMPSGEQSAVICTSGKTEGQIAIATDKGVPVNVTTAVLDAKGKKLGSISLQVLNKGQTENINIAAPEVTEPNFTWGNT